MEKEWISHQGFFRTYLSTSLPNVFKIKLLMLAAIKSGLDTVSPGLGMKISALGDSDIINRTTGSKYLHHWADDDLQAISN
jgi:hypothetical protein